MEQFSNDSLEEIWIVYTDYKMAQAFDQGALNVKRIQNLCDSLPWLKYRNDIKWRDKVCKGIKERSTAQSCFHGFVFIYKNRSTSSMYSIFQKAKSIIVVIDATGSTSGFDEKFVQWMKDHMIFEKTDRFVYFNDGDGRDYSERKVGHTGGIYIQKPKSYQEHLELVKKYREYGNPNQDLEENTFEAVIEAQKLAGPETAILLFADNDATPRDTGLIDSIHHPIHVLLAQNFQKRILPSLVNVAYRTGGSIHKFEGPVIDFKRKPEKRISNSFFEVGGDLYYIIRNQMIFAD